MWPPTAKPPQLLCECRGAPHASAMAKPGPSSGCILPGPTNKPEAGVLALPAVKKLPYARVLPQTILMTQPDLRQAHVADGACAQCSPAACPPLVPCMTDQTHKA